MNLLENLVNMSDKEFLKEPVVNREEEAGCILLFIYLALMERYFCIWPRKKLAVKLGLTFAQAHHKSLLK